MAFVNEYIPKADYEKYDLGRVCGERNEANPGRMYSRDWTVDRERDAFLVQVWHHRDSEFSGWAFYWKGEWVFFEVANKAAGGVQPDGSCWYRYLLKGFVLPARLESMRSALLADLERAFGDYCGGGVFSNYKSGTASIEFVEE